MFDYQIIKEKFYRLAQDAENNVRKDKLKAPKAPPVYEGLHDISLARRDVYTFLATSHFANQQDFVAALKRLLDSPAQNSNAFDEQKYAEAYANYLKELIVEYQ
jgi:hypothetical protein